MEKLLGAQVLADMLEGYGVTHVFMVPAVLRRTFVEIPVFIGFYDAWAAGHASSFLATNTIPSVGRDATNS